MWEFIRKFFMRETIVRALTTLPPLTTPALDFLFPEPVRDLVESPFIGKDDLGLDDTAIPLVRRGTNSYKVGSKSGRLGLIEVEMVNPSILLSAAQINNLMKLRGETAQQAITRRFDRLRRITRKTTEALCISSISGKISYPIRTDVGTYEYWEVDYGTPEAIVIATKFDAVAATVKDIILGLGKMKAAMQKDGYGNNIVHLAPLDVFAVIIEKVGSVAKESAVVVTPDEVVIGGGIRIRLFDYSYYDHKSKTMVAAIPAKTMIAYDFDANHKLLYAAVDDIEADFVATPFWPRAYEEKDPSGVTVIGQSKPLPVVNVKGMKKAVVLT